MLDAIDIPVIAMWKDGSLAVPNKAVARLMHSDTDPISDDARNILSRYKVYTEDFARELEQYEYPIAQLCREQTPFKKLRVGVMDSKSTQKVYEATGQCIYDEDNGEFQAGVCAFKDVTWYTESIRMQTEQSEQQFQLICETVPQIVSEFNQNTRFT